MTYWGCKCGAEFNRRCYEKNEKVTKELGLGYYWCNLDLKEKILPQLNGIWLGYKIGEWTTNYRFLVQLNQYIMDHWNGNRIGVYSETHIKNLEEKESKRFKRIILDGRRNIYDSNFKNSP